MVNLAQKDDRADSGQLADAEISRILAALQNAEFKKSDSRNARPDQTFKPRSLMEIAAAARHQEEQAAAQAAATEQDDDGSVPASDPVVSTDTAEMAAPVVDDVKPEPVTPAFDPAQPAQTAPDIMSEPETGPETGQAMTPQMAPQANTDAAAQTSPFETAQAAYDRGYADGVAAGRAASETEMRDSFAAAAEAKIADKIAALETALAALQKPETVDAKLLSDALQAAVIALAAERAGSAIDGLPDPMVARIDALGQAAGKKVSDGKVFLHPDDSAVIAPLFTARPHSVVVESDASLRRGDIRIRFDGMELADLIDERVVVAAPTPHAPPAAPGPDKQDA